MNYIKVPKNLVLDYIPISYELCQKCIYCGICPYDWECPSLIRVKDAERMMKE